MAKFNYDSKCGNRLLVEKIMTDFLQRATAATFEGEIRKVMLIPGTEGFRTDLYPDDPAIISITYDFAALTWKDPENRLFNRDFYTRCPASRGFADITLSLLHELGHNETLDDLPEDYDRVKELAKVYVECKGNVGKCVAKYLTLPDEWLATQWAVDWLKNPENRKAAKRFERKFFKAWREGK